MYGSARLPVRAAVGGRRPLRPVRPRAQRRLIDNGGAFTLTYWPSEFSQVRGEYRLHDVRRRRHGQRVPVPVPLRHRRARRARLLTSGARLCDGWCSCASVGSVVLLASVHPAAAALKVVATTEDLAAIAARGRRRQGQRRDDGARLSGSALRRAQAQLHPQAARGRSAGRRRARARDRLAAAAGAAEPQRQDPAGRATAISMRRSP